MKLEKNVKLSELTTIGLGGSAKFLARCKSAADIKEALGFAGRNKLEVFVLAGGSNVVFPDKGFGGLVLKVELGGIEFDDKGEYAEAAVAAGEDWDKFVLQCANKGLGGIECLSGIPGTAGATPIQNVGAYGQEVSETILAVRALDMETGEMVEFSNADCGFSYRASRFKKEDLGRFIILEVVFKLSKDGEPALRYPELKSLSEEKGINEFSRGKQALLAVRKAVFELRKKKSMILDPKDPNTRSCGSFFTNPTRLIATMGYMRIRAHQQSWQGSNPYPGTKNTPSLRFSMGSPKLLK